MEANRDDASLTRAFNSILRFRAATIEGANFIPRFYGNLKNKSLRAHKLAAKCVNTNLLSLSTQPNSKQNVDVYIAYDLFPG